MELSDVFLSIGIILIAAGLYFVFKPAAIIFLGISLILLAFLLTPKPNKDGKKGGE